MWPGACSGRSQRWRGSTSVGWGTPGRVPPFPSSALTCFPAGGSGLRAMTSSSLTAATLPRPDDACPHGPRVRGQRWQRTLHVGDERRPVAGPQQLLDVPRVLWRPRVELQQDQVTSRRDRQRLAIDDARARTLHDFALPALAPDDEVDGPAA